MKAGQPQKARKLLLRTARAQDPALIRRVAEAVYASYDGRKRWWEPRPESGVTRMHFGSRAGVVRVDVGGRTVCAKLFYSGMVRSRLRVAIGLGKALRAYRNGIRLRYRGIPCPDSLGYAELRPWGPAMAISELAEGFIGLDRWVAAHGAGRPFLWALARFVRRMHDAGVSHIDLLPRNVLVRQLSTATPGAAAGTVAGEGRFEFRLVDLEDIRFRGNVTRRRRLYELRHLNDPWLDTVPVKARLQFLRYYLGPGVPLRPWARPLRRAVFQRKTRDKVEIVRWPGRTVQSPETVPPARQPSPRICENRGDAA